MHIVSCRMQINNVFLQFFNKLWYAKEGAKDMMDRACADLPWQVRLNVDGNDIEIPSVSYNFFSCSHSRMSQLLLVVLIAFFEVAFLTHLPSFFQKKKSFRMLKVCLCLILGATWVELIYGKMTMNTMMILSYNQYMIKRLRLFVYVEHGIWENYRLALSTFFYFIIYMKCLTLNLEISLSLVLNLANRI